MLTADSLIERGNKLHKDSLTMGQAERGEVLCATLVPPMAKNLLKELTGSNPRMRLSKVVSDEPLKIEPFETSLSDHLRAIRDGRKITRGDRVLYPSRPDLTSLAVSSIVARYVKYAAHFAGEDESDPDRYAKYLMYSWMGQGIEAIGFSIQRAEGVLKTGARQEALRVLGNGGDESAIEKTAKRFQVYADKLSKDPTGLSTLEADLALRVVPDVSGIETELRSVPEGGVILPRTRLAAAAIGYEAYKLIYPHTEEIH